MCWYAGGRPFFPPLATAVHDSMSGQDAGRIEPLLLVARSVFSLSFLLSLRECTACRFIGVTGCADARGVFSVGSFPLSFPSFPTLNVRLQPPEDPPPAAGPCGLQSPFFPTPSLPVPERDTPVLPFYSSVYLLRFFFPPHPRFQVKV